MGPYRVISPTLFGFDESPRFRIPITLSDHLVILRALLHRSIAELAPSSVVFAGFSAGGDIALRLLTEVGPDDPVADGVLALGCNLSLETCFATRVFSRLTSNDDRRLLDDVGTLTGGAASLGEWLDTQEYLVTLLRRVGHDVGAVRQLAADIMAPFEADGENVFPRWYREAAARVKTIRCVFEDTPAVASIVRHLRLRHLDHRIFGERYRDESLILEPGASHFDLKRPEIFGKHLAAVIEGASS